MAPLARPGRSAKIHYVKHGSLFAELAEHDTTHFKIRLVAPLDRTRSRRVLSHYNNLSKWERNHGLRHQQRRLSDTGTEFTSLAAGASLHRLRRRRRHRLLMAPRRTVSRWSPSICFDRGLTTAITALLTGKNVCKRRGCLFITMADNVQLSDIGSRPPGIASQ